MKSARKPEFTLIRSSLTPKRERTIGLTGTNLAKQLRFSSTDTSETSETWVTLVYNPPSASASSPQSTPRILSARPVILDEQTESVLQQAGAPRERTLWVTALLDAQGNPTVTEAPKATPPELTELLGRELKHWRFAPARKAGQPIAQALYFPVIIVHKSSISPGILPQTTDSPKPIDIDPSQTYWISFSIGSRSRSFNTLPLYALTAPEIDLSDEQLKSFMKSGRRNFAVTLKATPSGKISGVSSPAKESAEMLALLKKNLRAWHFLMPREKRRSFIPLAIEANILSQPRDTDQPQILVEHPPLYPPELRELAILPSAPSLSLPSFPTISSSNGGSPTSRANDLSANSLDAPHKSTLSHPLHISILRPQRLLRTRGKFSGQTRIRFSVDEQGHVTAAHVIRSDSPLFEAPVIRSVFARIYRPAPGRGTIQLEEDFTFRASQGVEPTNDYMPFTTSPLSDRDAYDSPPTPQFRSPPVFPRNLFDAEIDGHAVADVHVDATGAVTRVDIAEASHPEFGLALQAALETCTFEPAQRNGAAVPAIIRRAEPFTRFAKPPKSNPSPDEARHAESITPITSAFITLAVEGELGPEVSFHKLDAPPQLLTTRPLHFPLTLPASVSEGQATVEFVIDAHGFVRTPRVISASHPAFGYAAIQSVAFWGYTSPVKRHAPVATTLTTTLQFSRPATAP